MRKANLRSMMIALALGAGSLHSADAAGGPPKKGGAIAKMPACWGELATNELDVRTRAKELAVAVGGDLGDRTSRAGALQAHARQTSFAYLAVMGHIFVFTMPWAYGYYVPSYFEAGCDVDSSTSTCVSLKAQADAKNAVLAKRYDVLDRESAALDGVAGSFLAAGNAPAVRAKASALMAAIGSLRSKRSSCEAPYPMVPLVPGAGASAPVPMPNTGRIDLGDVLQVSNVEAGEMFAMQQLAIAFGDVVNVVVPGVDYKLKLKVKDAIVVLRDGEGAFPVPSSLPLVPLKPTVPDPLAGKADHYDFGHIGGELELKVGKKTLRIADASIDGTPGDLRLGGAPMALGTCVQNLGGGSKIAAGKLQLSGKLKCGDVSGTSTINVGKNIDGAVKLNLFGHQFAFDVAWSGGELQGTTTWQAASSGWQSVPGVDLELRVEGPSLALTMKGSTFSATFDASKLELRSKSTKPDGNPWAYAYLDPPSQTVSTDGKIDFTPPALPSPGDPFKAARNVCIDAAKNTIPPGNARNAAISVCNTDNPAPPSIPSPPTKISVEVSVVTD
ncbi:MAG TPA: hypothetical protein VG755_02565 [Nannocystaceae bacterium]|nr:hypothetical protein [Nannocystaceae bacterium]